MVIEKKGAVISLWYFDEKLQEIKMMKKLRVIIIASVLSMCGISNAYAGLIHDIGISGDGLTGSVHVEFADDGTGSTLAALSGSVTTANANYLIGLDAIEFNESFGVNLADWKLTGILDLSMTDDATNPVCNGFCSLGGFAIGIIPSEFLPLSASENTDGTQLGNYVYTQNFDAVENVTVPEPPMFLLLLGGLIAVAGRRIYPLNSKS